MEGDGMSAADKVKEADWRLFRSRLPIWQEAYMERLNREYIALLSGTGPASEKFWELERRMREDKKRGGVVMRMSRSNMELNLRRDFHRGARWVQRGAAGKAGLCAAGS